MLIRYLPPELLAFRLKPWTLAVLSACSVGLLAASAALSIHFYKKAALI